MKCPQKNEIHNHRTLRLYKIPIIAKLILSVKTLSHENSKSDLPVYYG